MVTCLEQGADLHIAQLMPLPLTVSCFSKIQIGFTFLVPADLGSPGKRAVKRVCVCLLYELFFIRNVECLLSCVNMCTCHVCFTINLLSTYCCLQCFDTVGWAAGRASGQQKTF